MLKPNDVVIKEVTSEYRELETKIDKLEDFLHKQTQGSKLGSDTISARQYNLRMSQLLAMKGYSNALSGVITDLKENGNENTTTTTDDEDNSLWLIKWEHNGETSYMSVENGQLIIATSAKALPRTEELKKSMGYLFSSKEAQRWVDFLNVRTPNRGYYYKELYMGVNY